MSEKENHTFTDIASALKWIRTSLFSKDVLVFLFFLLLSTIFWVLHSLSKPTEIRLAVPVSYVNMPDDIVLLNKMPSSISILVKEQGSALLSYMLHSKNMSITIDLSKINPGEKSYCITNKELKDRILERIPPTFTLLNITPDSIPLQYSKLHTRKIPIKLKGKITLNKQYIAGEAVFSPPMITVYGDKNMLDSLQYIYTEKTDFKQLKDTVKCNLRLEKIENLKYGANSVNIFIPVEMFTEKILNIPIKVKNAPNGVCVRIFPAYTKVSCNVRLSEFNQLTEKSFSAWVDYRKLIKNQSCKEPLIFEAKANNVSNLQYSPDNVEFILEQNSKKTQD